METVSCDLCGSTEYRLYLQSRDYINKREGLFSVVRCNTCGLLFTNPRPDKREIIEFYPPTTPYYTLTEDVLKPVKQISGIYKILLQYFRNYFPEQPKRLFYRILYYPIYIIKKHKFDAEGIPYYVKNGRLLEIGCSYGKFLYTMKKLGWQCDGIEMSQHASTIGRSLFNLNIVTENIDEVEFDSNIYDAIIMRMVLEHVHSPNTVLKKIAHCLKPGGQLIIIVPDISGFEARLFGRYFYSLHLPNHLYHFSPETLNEYLKKHDLRTNKIYCHRSDKDFRCSIDNFLENNRHFFVLRFLKWGVLKMFIRFFIVFLSLIYRTGRMTVFTTRVENKNRNE